MNNERQRLPFDKALLQFFPDADKYNVPEEAFKVLDILRQCGWSGNPSGVTLQDLMDFNTYEISNSLNGSDLEDDAKNPHTASQRIQIVRQCLRERRFHKPMHDIEARGSMPQVLTLGTSQELFFKPRQIARELIQPGNVDLLGQPIGLAASVLRNIQNGPDLSLRIGSIPQGLYQLYEDELYKLDNRHDTDRNMTTVVRQIKLNKVNDSADHRKAMVVEYWDNKSNDPFPAFTISISTRPDPDQKATDNRSLDGMDIEDESKAAIEKNEEEYLLTLPDAKRLWKKLELVSSNSTQTVTKLSRFLLDYCLYGDDFLFEEMPNRFNHLEIGNLIDGPFWDRQGIYNPFFHPAHYKDIQEDQDMIFNYKKREAEIVSRLMVAYIFDPYRFMAAAHSLDLLDFLPIGNLVRNNGGFENWAKALDSEKDESASEKLTRLSVNYRKNIFPSLNIENNPWFNLSYLGLEDAPIDFSTMVGLLSPEFGRRNPYPYDN